MAVKPLKSTILGPTTHEKYSLGLPERNSILLVIVKVSHQGSRAFFKCARMAELVDAADLKSAGREAVGVRAPLWALKGPNQRLAKRSNA